MSYNNRREELMHFIKGHQKRKSRPALKCSVASHLGSQLLHSLCSGNYPCLLTKLDKRLHSAATLHWLATKGLNVHSFFSLALWFHIWGWLTLAAEFGETNVNSHMDSLFMSAWFIHKHIACTAKHAHILIGSFLDWLIETVSSIETVGRHLNWANKQP